MTELLIQTITVMLSRNHAIVAFHDDAEKGELKLVFDMVMRYLAEVFRVIRMTLTAALRVCCVKVCSKIHTSVYMIQFQGSTQRHFATRNE